MSPQLGFVLALVACTCLFLLLALRTSRIAKPSPPLEPTHPPITQENNMPDKNTTTRTFVPDELKPTRALQRFWEDFDGVEFAAGERHAEAEADYSQWAEDWGDAHSDNWDGDK